jgi:hypothetical protein
MLPLAPPVAEPERRTIEPLLPLEAVPDLRDTLPLTPLLPASADKTLNEPLLVDSP